MAFDLELFAAALFSPVFFRAALLTVALAVLAHASAIVLSLPLALGLDGGSKALRGAIRVYVGVFRAVPTLLWMLFFWNAMPQFSPVFRDSWYTPFVAAWVALTLNEAAYQVEINRAALNAVDKGQTMAATAFGFSPLQTFRLVTLPQAARVALPPTVNEFITLLKATSLASVISLQELMTVTNQAVATSFQFQEYYAVAATYYLAIVGLLTLGQARLERRLDWTAERRPASRWMARLFEQRR